MNCKICGNAHEWSREEIIRERSKTGDIVRKEIEGLTPEKLASRPDEESWSIHEIIVHLKDTEMIYGMRYKTILSENDPHLVAFDQELWAKNTEYEKQNFDLALTLLDLTRIENLLLIGTIEEKEYDKTGKHPEYGELSIRDLALHHTAHDVSHLKQIKNTREKIDR
jgi:hypothetical protein